MQTYLITLKYYGRIYLLYKNFDSEIILLNAVLNAIASGDVALIAYTEADMFDNGPVKKWTDKDVTETETIIEILMHIDDTDIDWHDGGDSLYHYMANELAVQHVTQVYAFVHQVGSLVKTGIGYRVQK
jgi:hypothetical protein